MLCSSKEEKNPFMAAFWTAAIFIALFAAGSQLFMGGLRLKEAVLGGVVVWIIYFGMQCWFNKRIEAKKGGKQETK